MKLKELKELLNIIIGVDKIVILELPSDGRAYQETISFMNEYDFRYDTAYDSRKIFRIGLIESKLIIYLDD